ncbi:hypothetical protein B0H14DRAFT_3860375, partial [Mycena olivaceomarginata]
MGPRCIGRCGAAPRRGARAEEGVGWGILVRLAWGGGCRVYMYVGQSRSRCSHLSLSDLITSHFSIYLVHTRVSSPLLTLLLLTCTPFTLLKPTASSIMCIFACISFFSWIFTCVLVQVDSLFLF